VPGGAAWRGGAFGVLGVSGRPRCNSASFACRLASSSASVSANSSRCSAVIASVLAPNFQRLSRASSKLSLSSLTSRQRDLALAPGQLLRIGLGLLLQPLDQCGHLGRQARQIDGAAASPGMRRHGAASRSRCHWHLRCQRPRSAAAQQRRMVASSPRRCQGRPSARASNCWVLSCSAGSHRARLGRVPDEAARMQPPRGAPHAEAVVHEQLDAAWRAQVGEQVAVVRAAPRRGVDDDR
jgi:hypothetical protein